MPDSLPPSLTSLPSVEPSDSCPFASIRGSSPLRRELTPDIQPVSGSAPVIDFVASDQSLDRYNEIIVAAGWRLDNYRRNPIIQNAHQYGDILFTIGKAVVTEVRDDHLYQRIEFATEINPMARIAYGLYKGKFLNALSVGFVPIRWEDGSDKSPYARKFLEQELLEVSAVGIPANPNALQLGLNEGAVQKSDLRDLADLLSPYLADSPPRRGELHEPSATNQSDNFSESLITNHVSPITSSTDHEIRSTLTLIHSLLRKS